MKLLLDKGADGDVLYPASEFGMEWIVEARNMILFTFVAISCLIDRSFRYMEVLSLGTPPLQAILRIQQRWILKRHKPGLHGVASAAWSEGSHCSVTVNDRNLV
jgi:hypothetical protein